MSVVGSVGADGKLSSSEEDEVESESDSTEERRAGSASGSSSTIGEKKRDRWGKDQGVFWNWLKAKSTPERSSDFEDVLRTVRIIGCVSVSQINEHELLQSAAATCWSSTAASLSARRLSQRRVPAGRLPQGYPAYAPPPPQKRPAAATSPESKLRIT